MTLSCLSFAAAAASLTASFTASIAAALLFTAANGIITTAS